MRRDFFIRKKKQVPKIKNQPVILDLSDKEMLEKNKMKEYLKVFIKPRVLKQRKSVYVSRDIQEFISKVVNKLDVKNVTVGVFIDTILIQHIKEHKEELMSIYYREENDIFENIINNNDDD